MPNCGVCGKTITTKEMEPNPLANLFSNAQFMPNVMQGLAMKCNRCGAWVCADCAKNAAMRQGAGMIQHSGCGGMFESL